MEAERPGHRFAAVLGAIAALMLALATGLAARSGAAGRTVLGEWADPIEAVIAFGGALAAAAGIGLGAVRWPAAAAAVLWLAWMLRQPVESRGTQPLVAALCLGWIAQSFLVDEHIAVGIALYACAVAAAALPRKPLPAADPPSPRLEMAAILLLLALFSVACLYRLDVFPALYDVDEMAYLRAARMFAGQVEVGRILGRGGYELYVYDQFAAQAIPLALQAAAIRLLPSDVLATRLLSVVAVAAALLAAVLALRRPLGPRATLWMLALGACAPLIVVYSRAGHYISISILHSALCFASLLWLLRRWDLPSAAVVGVLLGGSLYQYQLSWFVPVFALVSFAASRELWRRPGAAKVAGTVALACTLIALPGLVWLDAGFAAVGAQTFDHRAVWNVPEAGAPPSPHDRTTAVLAIAPDSLGEGDLEAFRARAESLGISASVERSTRGGRVVWVGGDRPRVEAVAREIRDAGWRVLGFDWLTRNPAVRLRQMLAQFFSTPGWESSGRWVGVPLFNPLLAPLLVLGLVLAWQRRREPALRGLLVWVVGGALLPAVVAGPAPRRASLMLPFAYALMALPLLEIGAGLRRRRPWGGPAAVVLTTALVAGVVCSGSFLYFRCWDLHTGTPGAGGILDFVQVLKTRSPEEVVLMPAVYRGLDNYLDAGEASRRWPERVARPLTRTPRLVARAMSCQQAPPFSWLAPDAPEYRAVLAWVEEHFVVESEIRNGIRSLRVVAVRDEDCRPPPDARRAVPPAAGD